MRQMANNLRLFLRATLAAGLITIPPLAVSQVNANDQTIIEAPRHKKKGAGLVLVVTLQRS